MKYKHVLHGDDVNDNEKRKFWNVQVINLLKTGLEIRCQWGTVFFFEKSAFANYVKRGLFMN
jgi:hypothetical protein